jgi:hypothetical protein
VYNYGSGQGESITLLIFGTTSNAASLPYQGRKYFSVSSVVERWDVPRPTEVFTRPTSAADHERAPPFDIKSLPWQTRLLYIWLCSRAFAHRAIKRRKTRGKRGREKGGDRVTEIPADGRADTTQPRDDSRSQNGSPVQVRRNMASMDTTTSDRRGASQAGSVGRRREKEGWERGVRTVQPGGPSSPAERSPYADPTMNSCVNDGNLERIQRGEPAVSRTQLGLDTSRWSAQNGNNAPNERLAAPGHGQHARPPPAQHLQLHVPVPTQQQLPSVQHPYQASPPTVPSHVVLPH